MEEISGESVCMEEGPKQQETSRPTTPSMNIFNIIPKNEDEWWRPSIPPETHIWEQIRRQRKKGGYPWTLLDSNEDEIDANEYLDDNLYEPVNPPLYESGSTNLAKDVVDTGSLDGRRLQIPPELDIITSDGLDGLDLPDPHEHGFDGDREWMHSEDEQIVPSKRHFTAGIRGDSSPEIQGSSSRPLNSKAITFDPETKNGENELSVPQQEGPVGSRNSPSRSRSRSRSPNPDPAKKTTTAFAILKNKAAGAADQMKQRFSRISLPARPKLSHWEMSRKKHKKRGTSGGKEEEAANEGVEDQVDGNGQDESMDTSSPQDEFIPPSSSKEVQQSEQEKIAAVIEKEVEVETQHKEKETTQASEAQHKEKVSATEEKKRKQKEQDELKKQKAEEKKREQEELKRQKAEEKQRAKEESEKKKAEERAAKQAAQEEAKKAKLQEQLEKALEAEEMARLKNEELLRQREMEDAKVEKAVISPDAASAEEEAHGDEEQPEVSITPTGTGARKKKSKKTFVQLPQLPKLEFPKLPDMEFKRRVIKRSKTPPVKSTLMKSKFQKREPEQSENKLGAQYANEIEARAQELEQEEEDDAFDHEIVVHQRFPEPPIFVTQPSTDPSEDADSQVNNWRSFPSSSWGSGETTEEKDPVAAPSTQQHAPSNKQGAKERFDKLGSQLKGFGTKSKDIAAKKSKGFGQTMKVIGKDLQKFGAKTSEKFQSTVEEIKAKQKAADARSKAKEAEDIAQGKAPQRDIPEFFTGPRRKFKFRRRNESLEEQQNEDQGKEPFTEAQGYQRLVDEQPNQLKEVEERRATRSQILGRADRDWESPLDLAHSREGSEEPFSSSRDSPPGSSLASSTFAHVRKQGVLEEIDSDEFFLREKGISEGEDEEEINRFLVEELRQAFRLQENALAGFDLDDEPQRPSRIRAERDAARKKEKEESQNACLLSSFQTFPPERPKRKTPGGYVSDYMKGHRGEEPLTEMEPNQTLLKEEEEFEDEGIRRVKEELGKIELQREEDLEPEEQSFQRFVDDGRYEPVREEEPIKPMRRKKFEKMPPSSTPLYYNTVAGNEWMKELEEQVVLQNETQAHAAAAHPEQGEEEYNEENEITFVDEPSRGSRDGMEEDMGYVDEGGYAIVHKEPEAPQTIPRRRQNKSGGSSKGNSLKRAAGKKGALRQRAPEGQVEGSPAFFSLPRYTPRTFHITPPSRPQRSAYSSLRPRRPPRHKSSHSLTKSKVHKEEDGGGGGGSRPSTAIRICMQGRPLPPPPPMNNLGDEHPSSVEASVGARHYANYLGGGAGEERKEVFEEPFVARNITLLGEEEDRDINIAIQTDPVQEYENDAPQSVVASFEEGMVGRVQLFSDSRSTTDAAAGVADFARGGSTGRETTREGEPEPPPQRTFQFPRRLHLDELEVDVLRVNDLSANSITVERLQAPQLEVNSLTALGALSVASIHTQTLNADQINCNRLSSDTVDLPTIVPPSFYNLATRGATSPQDRPEELRKSYKAEDEVVSSPFANFDENEDSLKIDRSFEHPSIESPSDQLFFSEQNIEFCLSPEQSIDNEDSWDRMKLFQEGSFEQTESTSPTPLEDDAARYSELQEDEGDNSAQVSSFTPSSEHSEDSRRAKPKEKFISAKFFNPYEAASTASAASRSKSERSRRTESPLGQNFRIAVLEDGADRDEKCLEEDYNNVTNAAVISGSLRLEYSRSPEIDIQVHHEIHTEEGVVLADGSVEKLPVGTARPSTYPVNPIRRSTTPSTTSTQPSLSREASTSTRSHSESAELDQLERPTSQSIPHAGEETQIGRIIGRVTMRGLQSIIDYIDIATTDDPSKANEQKAHMQVLLCILLIFIAGIILSSNSSTFSPPKWEFFMPPPHL